MQYGGNQQQRLFHMMMQARQQQQQQQQPAPALYHSAYGAAAAMGVGGLPPVPVPPVVPLLSLGRRPEPTFVTSLTENDVLLGRGTPCAENEGNVRFRRLVKSRKVEYIAAEKRMRKDAIAREILEVIASRGGKFLRKVESQAELEQLGVPLQYHHQAKEVWAIVDEDTQVQKVKQALRNKDDAAELMANAKEQQDEEDDDDEASSPNKKKKKTTKYGEHDVTNRFPRGVNDESDIHRADCKLQFGTGVLERETSNSSSEGKVGLGSSPSKGKTNTSKGSSSLHTDKKSKSISSPSSLKSTTKLSLGRSHPLPRDPTDLMTSSSLHHPLASPANQRLLSGRLAVDPLTGDVVNNMTTMMRRQMEAAAAADGDFRTLQELQRLRLMREQNLMAAPTAVTMHHPLGLGGLDGPVGAFGLSDQQQHFRMNAEFRQMQAAQQQQQQQQQAQMQQHMAAAARERLQRSSFTTAGIGLNSSAALAARQLQMEKQQQHHQEAQRRVSVVTTATAVTKESVLDNPTPPTATGRKGADSAGERAIGIAQAMKRAEAFSPAESLEVSHMETLILSVLCSHGLPVWTPEAHTKSFVSLPTFAKRLDWTWYGFASILKQKATGGSSSSSSSITTTSSRVEELALESIAEYQKDPRELATKTIMLLERLRRHCEASALSSQRKQTGLGMRVPLWLDRELSRWAMTLDIADPTGRPVPFSSTDFITEHSEYKQDPAVVATAAFDPPLADDVVEQVAMLTRLRSVFVKTKGRELHAKLEAAAKQQVDAWDDQPRGWDVEPYGTRDLLLCDRLLSEGFSGVLVSTEDLGTEYQLSQTSPRRFPSYESLGLTKASIQQRASQIARELHATEEQKELQRLQLDRMEKFAQSVLLSGEGSSQRSQKKRKGNSAPSSPRSTTPVDSPSGKKQKMNP